jgi:hypothetical protein
LKWLGIGMVAAAMRPGDPSHARSTISVAEAGASIVAGHRCDTSGFAAKSLNKCLKLGLSACLEPIKLLKARSRSPNSRNARSLRINSRIEIVIVADSSQLVSATISPRTVHPTATSRTLKEAPGHGVGT